MTDSALKGLVQDARHIHSGMECRHAEWVLLPYRSITTSILTMGKFGPQRMDEIFLGLLQHGVNTRKEIAKRLGVDEGEFIFTHLDVLLRNGYVVENQGVYTLTEQGESFASGGHYEERLQKISYEFCWGDMTAQIETNVQIAKKLDAYQLRHQKLIDEYDLTDKLIAHFNVENRENDMIFYDIASPERGRRFYDRENHAKYAALFYASKESGSNLGRVDLRIRNEKFDLCAALSRAANEEEYWREQFEKIYAKHIGSSS